MWTPHEVQTGPPEPDETDSPFAFRKSRFHRRLKRRRKKGSPRRKRIDSLHPAHHRRRRREKKRAWRAAHPGCRLPELARDADLRALIRAGQAQPPKHGVPRGYNLGCRCDACRAANTAAVAKYREGKRRRLRVSAINNLKHQVKMAAKRAEGAKLAREIIGDALPDAGKRRRK